MTRTLYILRTSKTAPCIGAGAGMWVGRPSGPVFDGAAIRTSVYATGRNLDVLAARGAG